MGLVWASFAVAAIAVALIGARLRRAAGPNAPALRAAAGWVLLLALATLAHPLFLGAVHPVLWAALYALEAVGLAAAAAWAGARRLRNVRRA